MTWKYETNIKHGTKFPLNTVLNPLHVCYNFNEMSRIVFPGIVRLSYAGTKPFFDGRRMSSNTIKFNVGVESLLFKQCEMLLKIRFI